MSFKNFRSASLITEAYENIKANDYAIISVNENWKEIEKELSDYLFYKVGKIPSYKSNTSTELRESYIIINNNNKEFKKDMINISNKYNQSNLLFNENKNSYLISSSNDINDYPGFGKIGVQIKLDFDIFNESGTLNKLPIDQQSIENGLNIIFPTEHSFKQ